MIIRKRFMPVNLVSPLFRQLGSAINVLKKAIENADEDVWTYGDPPFFQIVFHLINSMDLYFCTFDEGYEHLPEEYALPKYMQKYVELGFFDQVWDTSDSNGVISKEDMLHFLEETIGRVKTQFMYAIEQQFNDPSGFSWLNMNKFELILHNIRHIMGHTGVLNEYLKQNGCEITGWIGNGKI